jgi:hypothetical protein
MDEEVRACPDTDRRSGVPSAASTASSQSSADEHDDNDEAVCAASSDELDGDDTLVASPVATRSVGPPEGPATDLPVPAAPTIANAHGASDAGPKSPLLASDDPSLVAPGESALAGDDTISDVSVERFLMHFGIFLCESGMDAHCTWLSALQGQRSLLTVTELRRLTDGAVDAVQSDRAVQLAVEPPNALLDEQWSLADRLAEHPVLRYANEREAREALSNDAGLETVSFAHSASTLYQLSDALHAFRSSLKQGWTPKALVVDRASRATSGNRKLTGAEKLQNDTKRKLVLQKYFDLEQGESKGRERTQRWIRYLKEAGVDFEGKSEEQVVHGLVSQERHSIRLKALGVGARNLEAARALSNEYTSLAQIEEGAPKKPRARKRARRSADVCADVARDANGRAQQPRLVPPDASQSAGQPHEQPAEPTVAPTTDAAAATAAARPGMPLLEMCKVLREHLGLKGTVPQVVADGAELLGLTADPGRSLIDSAQECTRLLIG